MKISEEIREKIVKAQQLQQQLELLMYQKQGMSVAIAEIDNALKEIEGSDEKEVFEVVGTVMLKRKTADLQKKLKEKKDITDIRLKSLEKQIGSLAEKMKASREEINKEISKKGG